MCIKIYATAAFQGVPVVGSRELFGFLLLVVAPVESFLETVRRRKTIQVIIRLLFKLAQK